MLEVDVCVGVGVGVGVKSKGVKSVVEKRLVLPFNGLKDDNLCCGIRQNHGLYTQCESVVVNGEEYCKKCSGEARKNPSGKPNYGRIEDRVALPIMSYRDPKGKSPTSYKKVMKKLKISYEEAMEEAGKRNIILDEIHFVEDKVIEKKVKIQEASDKKKGRPKKEKKILEISDDSSSDLFASLVAKANEEVEDVVEESESESVVSESESVADSIIDVVLEKSMDVVVNHEKKEKKEKDKMAAKEQKAIEKEAALKVKAEKDAALKAEKEAVKAEKAAKDAAAKAEKAEKDAAAKAEKALKEAAAKAEKAEKDAIKVVEPEKQKKVASNKKPKVVVASDIPKAVALSNEPIVAVAVEAVKEDEPDKVKRFEFEGKQYLKSKKTGIIYNLEQDVIGKWNKAENKIDFLEQDSEEEEEDYEN